MSFSFLRKQTQKIAFTTINIVSQQRHGKEEKGKRKRETHKKNDWKKKDRRKESKKARKQERDSFARRLRDKKERSFSVEREAIQKDRSNVKWM